MGSSEKSYYLRRVAWKQRAPYKQKIPNTYAAECIIPHENVTLIIEKFSVFNLKKQKYRSDGITIDGNEYGIYFNDYRVNWFNAPSKEIRELAKWHEATLSQFEKFLP